MICTKGELYLYACYTLLTIEKGDSNSRGRPFDLRSPLRKLLSGKAVCPDAFRLHAQIEDAIWPLLYEMRRQGRRYPTQLVGNAKCLPGLSIEQLRGNMASLLAVIDGRCANYHDLHRDLIRHRPGLAIRRNSCAIGRLIRHNLVRL